MREFGQTSASVIGILLICIIDNMINISYGKYNYKYIYIYNVIIIMISF